MTENADKFPEGVHAVSTVGADAPTGDSTTAGRQRAAPGAEKHPEKARPGNRNAVKHGAYLNELKRGARALRDRFRRRGEREALAILKASGMEKDPLAKLVARQVGRLEAMAHRLESWHAQRGYFKLGGELKGSVSKEVEVITKLLDEARKLLEQLLEFRSRHPGDGDQIFVCEHSDGTPVPNLGGDAPFGLQPRDLFPVEAAPLPEADSPAPPAADTVSEGKEGRPEGGQEPQRPAPAGRRNEGDPLGLGWVPWIGGGHD